MEVKGLHDKSSEWATSSKLRRFSSTPFFSTFYVHNTSFCLNSRGYGTCEGVPGTPEETKRTRPRTSDCTNSSVLDPRWTTVILFKPRHTVNDSF